MRAGGEARSGKVLSQSVGHLITMDAVVDDDQKKCPSAIAHLILVRGIYLEITCPASNLVKVLLK
jgi:hypothetical protein